MGECLSGPLQNTIVSSVGLARISPNFVSS
jgi:hypothetical protein